MYRMSEYMTSQMCPCCVDEWESGGSDWNNPPPRLERMTQRRLDFNCAVLCPHKELLREALKHRRAEKLHKKRKEERRRREERDRKRQESEGAKKVSKRVTAEKVKRDAMEVDFDGKVAVRETEDGEAAPRVTARIWRPNGSSTGGSTCGRERALRSSTRLPYPSRGRACPPSTACCGARHMQHRLSRVKGRESEVCCCTETWSAHSTWSAAFCTRTRTGGRRTLCSRARCGRLRESAR